MKGRSGQVDLSPDALSSVCNTPETGIRFQYLLNNISRGLTIVSFSSGFRLRRFSCRMMGYHRSMKIPWLAHSSHRVSTAAGDAQHPVTLSRFGVLAVLQVRLRAPQIENATGHGTSPPSLRNPVR